MRRGWNPKLAQEAEREVTGKGKEECCKIISIVFLLLLHVSNWQIHGLELSFFNYPISLHSLCTTTSVGFFDTDIASVYLTLHGKSYCTKIILRIKGTPPSLFPTDSMPCGKTWDRKWTLQCGWQTGGSRSSIDLVIGFWILMSLGVTRIRDILGLCLWITNRDSPY